MTQRRSGNLIGARESENLTDAQNADWFGRSKQSSGVEVSLFRGPHNGGFLMVFVENQATTGYPKKMTDANVCRANQRLGATPRKI